jgi:quercetin dioxygenase-like cupin family protein
MSASPLISTPAEQATPKTVLGTEVTILAESDQAGGLAVTRQRGDSGMGPPPHSHDWDEMFYVIRGRVDFICGDTARQCEAGSLIFVPAGTAHGFQYGPEGGEMLEVTGLGTRAVDMFADLHDLVPPGPPDIPTVIKVLDGHGVSLHL